MAVLTKSRTSTGSTTKPARGWRALDGLVQTGRDIRFYGKVLIGIPSAIRHYPREILRILSEVSFGTGALAVIGGTIGVMTGMSIFVGTVVGMQDRKSTRQNSSHNTLSRMPSSA